MTAVNDLVLRKPDRFTTAMCAAVGNPLLKFLSRIKGERLATSWKSTPDLFRLLGKTLCCAVP